jgi:DNA-binding NtrC family response regulator
MAMAIELYPTLPVLLVDDEAEWLRGMRLALLKDVGINNVVLCQDSREVLPTLSRQPVSLLLLDVTMPHLSGEQLLPLLRQQYPDVPVIVVTGRNELEIAVNCMREGAFDYFLKVEEMTRLFTSVRRAMEVRQVQLENQALKARLLADMPTRSGVFAGILTASPKMEAIFGYIEAISSSSEPVLLVGESGVGKELLAQAIHETSRSGGPWVAINAAGLDDQAFTDTLFGHLRGAFTGADRARAGLVEQAAGGTLFLDEIGDLEPASQIKLLRFIQDGEYYPLGGDQPKKGRARLIFATHQDLPARSDAGTFRRDLYFRLRTHQIIIPPLRERPEDIPLLLRHFVEEAATRLGRTVPGMTGQVAAGLARHAFPGNVRELRALVYEALSQHGDGVLTPADFPLLGSNEPYQEENVATDGHTDDANDFPTIREAVRKLVAEALARTGGNRTAAAKLLGISQPALSKRLKKMAEGTDEDF